MLRYNGMVFEMADGNGITHIVRQVSSATARKMYIEGKTMWLLPCNMKVNNVWQKPQPFTLANTTDPFALKIAMFEMVVDSYQYYNCNNKRGRYPIYFVPIG